MLSIGTVIEVSGSQVVVELDRSIKELSRVYGGDVYDIGQFGSIIKVHFGRRLIYAMVRRLRMKSDYEAEHGITGSESTDERIIEADLIGEGEIRDSAGDSNRGEVVFGRGVATYPLPQQTVYLTPKVELGSIYSGTPDSGIDIGEHVGTGGVRCYADMNELLGKHTAILGTTGSGKSAAVAAIVHSILEKKAEQGYARWNPRIVILDPHDEYRSAFPQGGVISPDDGTLQLPYWLLSLQETIDMLIGRTEYVATSQANIVKDALAQARQAGAAELGLPDDSVTVDSPVPYSLNEFRASIEDSKPPQASRQESHNTILEKLRVLRDDSRMNFMMNEWASATIGDDGKPDNPLVGVMMRLFGSGQNPRIVDLSGIPNEIAGIVSGVIARTLFNWKIWQTAEERRSGPIVFVCEEAHLYVPNRGDAQYAGAQSAVRRLVREGRKYGVGLVIVSQRPSEIDPTVLSQCSSWIVLRIGNEVDRQHVRAALPDSMEGFTEMLASLRRQEALFLGQATALPSRIRIRDLDKGQLPASQDIDFDAGWRGEDESVDAVRMVAERWQLQGKTG